jgi:hypothetical protein
MALLGTVVAFTISIDQIPDPRSTPIGAFFVVLTVLAFIFLIRGNPDVRR